MCQAFSECQWLCRSIDFINYLYYNLQQGRSTEDGYQDIQYHTNKILSKEAVEAKEVNQELEW